MQWVWRRRVAIAGLLAGLAFLIVISSGARAFDRLERLLPAMVATAGSRIEDEVFRFVDFGSIAPAVHYQSGKSAFSSGAQSLDLALADPGEPSRVTGMRLDQVQAVLIYGAPPGDIIALLGPRGFASAAPEVLAKRGFETSRVDGLELHAIGEDWAATPNYQSKGDPFGHLLGASQRIVILDDIVVVARGSRPAVLTALALGRQSWCWRCRNARNLASALRSIAGNGARLRTVSGYTEGAFLRRPETTALLPGKAAASPGVAGGLPRLPSFDLAVFAHVIGPSADTLNIALLFADAASAEKAMSAIAARLGADTWGTAVTPVARGAQLPRIAEIRTTIVEAGHATVGIVTVSHGTAGRDAAAHEFNRWHAMIQMRDFWPMRIVD